MGVDSGCRVVGKFKGMGWAIAEVAVGDDAPLRAMPGKAQSVNCRGASPWHKLPNCGKARAVAGVMASLA